jgi:hypothetical protein
MVWLARILARLMRCPTCEKEFDPSQSSAKPFCSERCRTIDLGRWLDESYSLPVVPEADERPEADPAANGESHNDER